MKTLLSILTVLFFSVSAFAQSLYINDPQNWRWGQGTIESTNITYEPKGLFMKVDWEITFSAKGLAQFTESDTVEVVYNFNLPQGALIIDSWLWFNDSILKAKIMDRWSASQIYETIVNRRRDPSILYKNGASNYLLRIFPMAAKESRKVKITFLTPATWSQNSVSSAFLSENLLVSNFAIDSIKVRSICGSEWENPLISGDPDILLQPVSGGENAYSTQLIYSGLQSNQKFVVNSPLRNSYYFSYFEDGDEKFYQLALDPLDGMSVKMPQKILFLVDFQQDNTSLTQSNFLNLLQANLKELLSEKDSFNLLYYNFELNLASENWIAGNSASISQAFSNLGDSPFASYSNLPSLLASGIERANEETETKLILLANSDKLDETDAANELISDLLELMEPDIPVYIGDFQTKNYYYNWIGNYRYRGNEYLYRNLAKLSGGDYYHLFDGGTFSDCVQNIFHLATRESGLVDIHTSLENGFCYGRFTNTTSYGNILSDIYIETGRYTGDYPFKINVAGKYGTQFFSKSINISGEVATKSDSLSARWWYGKEILEMENSPYSYSAINDIIDKSIDNRILSYYTAFLCLEPGIVVNPDENQQNQGWETGEWNNDGALTPSPVNETPSFEINLYPNPFSDRVTIEIHLPEGVSNSDVQAEIYDLFGKRIKVFNVNGFDGESEVKLIWDARDDKGAKIPTGTYLFICNTSEGRITKKLVVL